MPGLNHNCPTEWVNPESFDPTRFSPERCEHAKNQYNYIPFGGGAHKCIGMHFARMQGIMFISHFVTMYDFAAPGGYKAKFKYLPLPKIRDGLPLILRPRQ
jgi:cytochrome P450